jgi:hypothetical protein
MIKPSCDDHRHTGPARVGRGVVLAASLVVLIGGGLGHRLLAKRIGLALNQSLPLVRPLATLPLSLSDWQGRDVPLDSEVQRVAAEDDFIDRQYRCDRLGRTVGLYVGYVGRPRSRLGHRPDICYPVSGWDKIEETRWQVPTHGSNGIPSILYGFRAPDVGGPRDLVLATYLTNGQYRDDPSSLGGYNSRQANPFGRGSAYLARIQIRMSATGDRDADLAALSDFASLLMEPVASLMPHPETASASVPAAQ